MKTQAEQMLKIAKGETPNQGTWASILGSSRDLCAMKEYGDALHFEFWDGSYASLTDDGWTYGMDKQCWAHASFA